MSVTFPQQIMSADASHIQEIGVPSSEFRVPSRGQGSRKSARRIGGLEHQLRRTVFQTVHPDWKSGLQTRNSELGTRNLSLKTLLVVALFLLVPSGLQAAGAQSMQSFLELKPQWSEFVGTSFRIEGQYAILVRDSLRMKNCDLPFRASQPIKLVGTSRVLEVSGRLAKEANSGKLYFEIDQVRQLPTDLQTLTERERTLLRAAPKQWYELAEWAAARGKFYNDEELLERAKVISRKGLNLERQELKELTPSALRTLSSRIPELGLEESLRLDWLHESYWLEWEALQKSAPQVDLAAEELDDKKDPVFQLLNRLDKDLPGAKTRVEEVLPLLVNEYRRHSVLTYHNASEAKRRTLERLFHIEIAAAAIARFTKPDGSNGEQIAARLDDLIAEQHELAEKHRDAELGFLAKTAATLTRNQLGELVQRCRDRKQEMLAKEALSNWLTRREQSLRKDGVTGLIQLADERLALVQDQPGASALLLEALQLAPKNEDVIERLKKLGYQEVNGQWVAPPSNPAAPIAPQPVANETDLERFIRLGVPKIGMTPAQLLKCLGSPQSLTRVATSGRVTETWVYREGTTVRYRVTVERRPNRGTSEVLSVK